MNQYIGKSRGGNTTKIHAVVDGLGNPVYFELSGGNINDNTVAIDLLSNIDIKSANILGDRAYGTKDIRTYITSKKRSIQFRQSQILKNHGIVTGGFTKNAIWLNAFSTKSNILEELRHAMISWRLRFIPLFTLPRSGFYQNDQHFYF